ncbi:MAG: glycosyltransferase family 39 protein [Anaerolineae bacterium]|nr:glycosyltransferase family 39 protein [Anaerolineae bacterium]
MSASPEGTSALAVPQARLGHESSLWPSGNRARWRGQIIVLALLLVGTVIRLPGIGQIPAGLYHDEAQNGLDALGVLGGDLRLYFPANNGREPIYIYLVAAAIAFVGRSPIAVRLPAAYAGVLTLAATYRLGQVLWGRRAGRWALSVLAVTLWHAHLSRIGFRAVLLPLFTALCLAQGARAVRSGQSRHWIAAGLIYGASWYSYMAARFTPIALAALILYALAYHRDEARRLGRGLALAAGAALIVLLPLGIYTLRYPDVVLARSGQVSVFSEVIHGGQPWRTVLRHTLATAGMFTVRGDRIWRHNLALRPVWEPALSLVFILGLGVALARFRRDAAAATVLLWTGCMALPTLLAEDAPHFLRGVGVLPAAALLPAMGLEWMATRTDKEHDHSPQVVGHRAYSHVFRIALRSLPYIVLAIGLASTTYDYFVRYRFAPLASHWFESGPVQLAGHINALRGAGWDGDRMLRGTGDRATVAIDAQLWDTWAALPFLVPSAGVQVLPAYQPPPDGRTVAFVVWPYREWEPDVLPYLPHPAYLRVERGPEAQGDRDPHPFTIATIIVADALPEIPPVVATFEHGMMLRAALVKADPGSETQVALWWDAADAMSTDYTVFVHYLRNGARIAQHDGQPGLGHLRTTFWRPGDLVMDLHPLPAVDPQPGIDTLLVGLYEAASGAPARVVSANGQAASDAVTLPVIIMEQP